MKFETFESIVNTLKEQGEILSKLYEMNVDLIEFVDPHRYVISTLIEELYGEGGLEMFDWFCYDRDYGKRTDLTAHDADGNLICQDLRGLWEYMEKYK